MTDSDSDLLEVKDENIFGSEDMIIFEAEYIDDDPLMKADSDENIEELELQLDNHELLVESQFESFGDCTKSDIKSRCTYKADEKLEAMKYAEKTSNRQAAKLFGIDESCIRKWRKQSLVNLRRVPTESENANKADVELQRGVELQPQEIESEECVKTKKARRKSYSSNQKLEAIGYAELVGNRKAAKVFLVDESCIRKWRLNKELLIEIDRERGTKRKPNLHWPLLDAELKSWAITVLSSGVRLKPGEIKAKSIEIAKSLNLTDFKGTSSYISKFMERYRIPGRQPKIIVKK